MAEMEVNAAPQLGLDAHLDDDLINYDSDAEKSFDQTENIEATEPVETVDPDNVGGEEQGEPVADDDAAHPEVDFFEDGENDDPAAFQPVIEPANEDPEGVQEMPHEIDYDFDEPIHQGNDAAVAEGEDEVSEEQQHSEENLHEERTVEDDASASKSGDHEISWEGVGEQGDDGEAGATGGVDEHIAQDEPPTSKTEYQLAAERHGDAAGSGEEEEEADSDNSEAAGDEMEHDEELQDDTEEQPHSQQGYSDVDEHGFPAITVQYKGDEFPFFSLSSEGFFSQLSVLDDSLESLLSGLREELVNELLPEDVLVFQVDELGLEFAESSSPEVLTNVTLRQILEVFDILVKNQDPESNRPLYTYLFTRPSTSKRLDFLMESATEGKGLDEVIHLFQNPVPQHTGRTDISVGDDFDTQVDDYDSAENDHAVQEQETGDASDEEKAHGQDWEAVEEHAAPSRQDDTNNVYQDDEPTNDPGEFGIQENDAMEETDKVTELFDEAVASGALAPDDDVGDGENPDQVGDEDHDLIGLDFDEPAEALGSSPSETEDRAIEGFFEDANANLAATDASTTTTTVKDDGEDTSTPVEMAALDTIIDAAAMDSLVEQDDLAEIDWRDEAIPQLNDGAAGDETSGAVKRARGDDDVGAEDDNNAKRQRS